MAKTLEFSQIDLADRRAVERVVMRYRTSTMSRADLVRRLSSLGFERDSVVRYAGLLDSTIDAL